MALGNCLLSAGDRRGRRGAAAGAGRAQARPGAAARSPRGWTRSPPDEDTDAALEGSTRSSAPYRQLSKEYMNKARDGSAPRNSTGARGGRARPVPEPQVPGPAQFPRNRALRAGALRRGAGGVSPLGRVECVPRTSCPGSTWPSAYLRQGRSDGGRGRTAHHPPAGPTEPVARAKLEELCAGRAADRRSVEVPAPDRDTLRAMFTQCDDEIQSGGSERRRPLSQGQPGHVPDGRGRSGCYAIADGMGGHAAGEVASDLAITALAESLRGSG